jgi:hypothetical protein
MNKTSLLWVLLLITSGVSAQKQTEYNRQGDEAMSKLDYSVAKILYEEGVSNCDTYSIGQLTAIWFADESMRPSLRVVMNKCLNCLTDLAMQNKDTTSMQRLVLYYTEGIGTAVNQTKANYWQAQLQTLRKQSAETAAVATPKKQKSVGSSSRTEFFVGYSASLLAPYGLSVGAVGKNAGFYLRYRTNLSFADYTATCDKAGNIDALSGKLPNFLGTKKENIWMATGGLLLRPSQSFIISLGGGYWTREALYEFETIGITVSQPEGKLWAKNTDFSYSGIAADLDIILRIGKSFYLSAGASAFNFKYVYANAGIGFFF